MTDLVAKAIEIATASEVWSGVVQCSPRDYRAAGLPGDEYRIPVPRPMVGSAEEFFIFTHPLSPERFSELAAEAKARTHIIRLIPLSGVRPGTLLAGEMPSLRLLP